MLTFSRVIVFPHCFILHLVHPLFCVCMYSATDMFIGMFHIFSVVNNTMASCVIQVFVLLGRLNVIFLFIAGKYSSLEYAIMNETKNSW